MYTIPEGESLILPDGTMNPNATLGYKDATNYFIPDEALKVFDDEFDYRETANSRELTDRAVALFVGMMSAQAAPSGGGGGGSSDLPWGRREDEDDREWARRCAREAEKMIGKRPKTGRKR